MNKTLVDREHNSILQTYKRLPITVQKAEGCRIYDTEGNSWLDFLGGIAVNALGHSHPAIIEAAEFQLRKYMHVSNFFYQEPQIKLAEKLKQITGYSKVFFTNSGTEAVEGAIKIARRWGNSQNKKDMFGFSGAFHGRTYGALSLMDKPLYKDGMGPFLPSMSVLPYNNAEVLKAKINKDTIAVIIEFLQGEGGIISANKDFINELFDLKNKYHFLVIGDEIQAGCGRTGKFLSYEHYGVKPDIVTMAKGIGGGFPLGAILVNKELEDIFQKGMHGTTFGGNAVACAAGYTVIDELEKGLLDNVVETGKYLKVKLEEIHKQFHQKVIEVRGMGLMQGIFLSFDASILVEKMIVHNVITNASSGTVLRLVPPLIAGKGEVDELISALKLSLEEIN